MKTNDYGSDFGICNRRIDIILDIDSPWYTVDEVIELIIGGETYIKANVHLTGDAYDNKLCDELNAIGIGDIHYGFGVLGTGYTCYKG